MSLVLHGTFYTVAVGRNRVVIAAVDGNNNYSFQGITKRKRKDSLIVSGKPIINGDPAFFRLVIDRDWFTFSLAASRIVNDQITPSLQLYDQGPYLPAVNC